MKRATSHHGNGCIAQKFFQSFDESSKTVVYCKASLLTKTSSEGDTSDGGDAAKAAQKAR